MSGPMKQKVKTAAQFRQYVDKHLYKCIDRKQDRDELRDLMFKCYRIGVDSNHQEGVTHDT